MKMNISKFDVADYLDSNEMIAEYLNTVLEDGNEADLVPTKFVQSPVGRSKTTI